MILLSQTNYGNVGIHNLRYTQFSTVYDMVSGLEKRPITKNLMRMEHCWDTIQPGMDKVRQPPRLDQVLDNS